MNNFKEKRCLNNNPYFINLFTLSHFPNCFIIAQANRVGMMRFGKLLAEDSPNNLLRRLLKLTFFLLY